MSDISEQEDTTSLTLVSTEEIITISEKKDWHRLLSNDSPIETTTMPDQSIRITHKNNYKISPENYSQWPKFYSIVLEKNTVSLEFRNNPDFSSIYNVLSLFQADFEFRDIPQSENNQHMLKITSNGILVLGYLYNIYSAFSIQATEVLNFVLIYIAEYEINKKNPNWKQDISMRVVAWSDPDDDEVDLLEIENFCLYHPPYYPHQVDSYLNYNLELDLENHEKYYEKLELIELKKKYRNLTPEEKQAIFRNLTLELINKEVDMIISECNPEFIKQMTYYQKYEKIEKIFETTDKCNHYLYKKNDTIKPCVDKIQSIIEQKLNELFTPSIVEQLSEAIFSDSGSKYAKSGSSAVGGTLDILKATGQFTAKLPVIGLAIGVAKLYSSGIFFSREGGLISNEEKKEINFLELSQSFTCKVTICSLSRFINISPESHEDLALFYAKFIYKAITKSPNPYPSESYLANHLLDKLSNQTYVESLEIKELSTKLTTSDNQFITIKDYIQDYNQTICYAEIHSELMGVKNSHITSEIEVNFDNKTNSTNEFIENGTQDISNLGETKQEMETGL